MEASTSAAAVDQVAQRSVAGDHEALLGVEAAAPCQRPGVEEAVDALGLVEPTDVEHVPAGRAGGARVGHPGRADRDAVGGKAVGDEHVAHERGQREVAGHAPPPGTTVGHHAERDRDGLEPGVAVAAVLHGRAARAGCRRSRCRRWPSRRCSAVGAAVPVVVHRLDDRDAVLARHAHDRRRDQRQHLVQMDHVGPLALQEALEAAYAGGRVDRAGRCTEDAAGSGGDRVGVLEHLHDVDTTLAQEGDLGLDELVLAAGRAGPVEVVGDQDPHAQVVR